MRLVGRAVPDGGALDSGVALGEDDTSASAVAIACWRAAIVAALTVPVGLTPSSVWKAFSASTFFSARSTLASPPLLPQAATTSVAAVASASQWRRWVRCGV
ncbi:MAG TPA: hypothetical protein VE441_11710 [Mycobacterium sp.]|nr:hypothetical protein [Mycobacterium sp.]